MGGSLKQITLKSRQGEHPGGVFPFHVGRPGALMETLMPPSAVGGIPVLQISWGREADFDPKRLWFLVA